MMNNYNIITWTYFADNYALFGGFIYFALRFLWAGRIIIGMVLLAIPILIVLLSYKKYIINKECICVKSFLKYKKIRLVEYDRIRFRSAGLWTGQFVGIMEGSNSGSQKILLPRNENKRTFILRLFYDLDFLMESEFLERHGIK